MKGGPAAMLHSPSSKSSVARHLQLAVAFSFVLLVGCSPRAEPTQSEWSCPPLPHEISNADLVGTWTAEYGAATDSVTIALDGTFLQSYIRHSDGYSFTSEGRWRLETRESTGHYLHLEGMRRCDDTDELCSDPAGGSGLRPWFDSCEGRYLTLPEEVVLLVTGEAQIQDLNPSPAGIWLRHLALDSSSGSFHFTRLDE
jgi:hypothetical protein